MTDDQTLNYELAMAQIERKVKLLERCQPDILGTRAAEKDQHIAFEVLNLLSTGHVQLSILQRNFDDGYMHRRMLVEPQAVTQQADQYCKRVDSLISKVMAG